MVTETRKDNVRAVGRALDILLAFSEDLPELSAAELLERVDLSRPTLYRLIYTLLENGFLVSVGEPQRFRLGPAVARLSHVWSTTLDLRQIATPLLERLREQTRETVSLFVPQGSSRLCIAELPSPQPLNFKRGVGHTERIVRGATGRAILAFIEPPVLTADHDLSGTGIRARDLSAELAATRKRGYSTSRGELIPGAVAVAVPFFDQRTQVAGSIGVFGPEVRLSTSQQRWIAGLLMEAASQLSTLLGCPPRGQRVQKLTRSARAT